MYFDGNFCLFQGGRLIFLEHVMYGSDSWLRTDKIASAPNFYHLILLIRFFFHLPRLPSWSILFQPRSLKFTNSFLLPVLIPPAVASFVRMPPHRPVRRFCSPSWIHQGGSGKVRTGTLWRQLTFVTKIPFQNDQTSRVWIRYQMKYLMSPILELMLVLKTAMKYAPRSPLSTSCSVYAQSQCC